MGNGNCPTCRLAATAQPTQLVPCPLCVRLSFHALRYDDIASCVMWYGVVWYGLVRAALA